MIAPEFSLLDQHETVHSLKEYAGKWLVLYFYPKDDTPGCTTEACSIRDTWSEFEKQQVAVIGISADSPKSHKKFAEKYNLNFPLLSDPEKETIKAYGSYGKKKFLGKEFEGILRKTFIINPMGEIVKEYPKVTPKDHASEILQDIYQFQAA